MSTPEQDYTIIDPACLLPEQQIEADEIATTLAAQALVAPLAHGSLWQAIWTMSWPLTVTTIATSVCGMVDLQVAGSLGSAAQAAVGLAEQIIFLFIVFIMSLGVGTTAIVSRAAGEQNMPEAERMTGQSLVVSVCSALLLTLIALLLAHYLVPLFSKAPAVVAQCNLYLSIFALYTVPFSLICVINAAFRAIGNARIPLLIVLTEVSINITGDYLTVTGNWPVPGLGITGIAFSAVIGALAGALLALVFISKSQLKNSTKLIWPFSWTAARRILSLGIPSAIQRLAWAASVFAVFFILSKVKDPTAALASWSIGMRLESFLFMPLLALSLTISSIVGQNLGAKAVDRAIKASWHVTWIGVALMLVLSVALYMYSTPLARLMSHDPRTVAFTASYLRINAFCEPFLAINMILSGALQGAGDTRVPMLASIFGNWLVRLPVAWFLSLQLGWGPDGVWLAMVASILASTIIVVLRFQTGGWIHQRV